MQTTYDYQRYLVLYVDDEELSLKYFSRAFGDQFRILTARNVAEGLKLVQAHAHELGLLLTDQRMPGGNGTELLERARQIAPRAVRILVTAYADLESAIQAVNTGAIYKYITKPWEPRDLEATLKRALEFYIVQNERDQLLREKLSVLHDLVIRDRVISLGVAASGLGHYVRNALVAVQTFLDLAPRRLEEETLATDQVRNPRFWHNFYQHARAQVERITGMLQFLNDAAEPAAVLFTPGISLPQLVKDRFAAAQPQFAARSLATNLQIPEDLPPLVADKARLEKLFDFLFEEEVTTLPEGGCFWLSARLVKGAGGAPDEVELTFEDNGPGVSGDSLRALFDPFYARSGDPRQSGIRLMACYFIVHHHNGRIRLETRPVGSGMKLLINLPIQPPAGPPKPNEEEFLKRVLLNDRLWEKILSGV